MAKYRIKVVEDANGSRVYRPQYRTFGIWLNFKDVYETFTMPCNDYVIEFRTQRQAENYIRSVKARDVSSKAVSIINID